MKKLTRSMVALVLAATFLCGVVPVASAIYKSYEPIQVPGWEDWNPTLFQVSETSNPNIRLLCPKENATDDEVYYYVGKFLSENSTETSRITMQFPQTNWSKEDGDKWRSAHRGFLQDKRWYFGEMYTKMETWFADGILNVSMEAVADGPDMELVAKVREIGEAAKAASDTARGQVVYVSRYLDETVTYAHDGMPELHNSARAALVERLAYCGGYANALSAVCDYLGIPNTTISNHDIITTGASHAWNAVYVEGTWKQIDTLGGSILNNGVDNEYVDGVYIHVPVYDKEILAFRQAAILKGWEGITAPYRSMEAVNVLTERGILRGDQSGNLNLNSGLTRAELATILTRIGGAEGKVMAEKDLYAALCTFTDVPDWAKPYVGYCVEQGLVQGYNSETYGATDPVTPAAACTVILRHMGYSETDWSYNTAIGKAASVGLVSPYWPTGTVALRADMALLAYAAINK